VILLKVLSSSFLLIILVDNISLEIPLQEVASGELYLKLRERAENPANHSVFGIGNPIEIIRRSSDARFMKTLVRLKG
jgi:hypothetical protein